MKALGLGGYFLGCSRQGKLETRVDLCEEDIQKFEIWGRRVLPILQ
ncbi:hypothetical protein BRCON_2295 [Candidatus Sumerlaea chitinivorans]|uniref:Uncharacterized protein n=1 Tax=Sumerlaea chitinivorans TaxID=2250252 RepID=A0A2Z4Y8R6_SUMC1|nr:hypothetical protein BRCON_2295 [Candidatus Sumerlaea chitinivorans]